MNERVQLTTSDGLSLDARLGAGARGAAVIAAPHPLYGGRMDNPVVEALAEGFARAGLAALCFDYRGCGGSQGRPSGDASDADADYAAALGSLAQRSLPLLVAAGYSFGAAAALRAAAMHPSLQRVIVVAPPVSMLDRHVLQRIRGPIQLAVGSADVFSPLPALERALAGLSNVSLTVLDGSDHFFALGTEELVAFGQRASGCRWHEQRAASLVPVSGCRAFGA